jgi:hypothetical protein
VAIVNGTLKNARADVEQVIDLGKKYVRRFLD